MQTSSPMRLSRVYRSRRDMGGTHALRPPPARAGALACVVVALALAGSRTGVRRPSCRGQGAARARRSPSQGATRRVVGWLSGTPSRPGRGTHPSGRGPRTGVTDPMPPTRPAPTEKLDMTKMNPATDFLAGSGPNWTTPPTPEIKIIDREMRDLGTNTRPDTTSTATGTTATGTTASGATASGATA